MNLALSHALSTRNTILDVLISNTCNTNTNTLQRNTRSSMGLALVH